MVHAISSVVCENFQELKSGESNYIGVFDEVYGTGETCFDLVTKWYGNGELIIERVEVISPKEELICISEQELKVDGIQVTLNEFEINFELLGEYWLLLYESDQLINKILINVIGDV